VIRTWEDARAANAFPRSVKKQLSDPKKDWTLERIDNNTWILYQKINGVKTNPIILKRDKAY
jgi:hypothetical protein